MAGSRPHWAVWVSGTQRVPAQCVAIHPLIRARRHFDMAAAMGRTRTEYVGLARQDALDAGRDAGFETRVLDLPASGVVAWRDDLRSDRLNLGVDDGTVIRATVF
jgi:hypothetical protein